MTNLYLEQHDKVNKIKNTLSQDTKVYEGEFGYFKEKYEGLKNCVFFSFFNAEIIDGKLEHPFCIDKTHDMKIGYNVYASCKYIKNELINNQYLANVQIKDDEVVRIHFNIYSGCDFISINADKITVSNVRKIYDDKQFVDYILTKESSFLEYIPFEKQTYEMCIKCVTEDGKNLRFVSTKYKTSELLFVSTSTDYYAISNILYTRDVEENKLDMLLKMLLLDKKKYILLQKLKYEQSYYDEKSELYKYCDKICDKIKSINNDEKGLLRTLFSYIY